MGLSMWMHLHQDELPIVVEGAGLIDIHLYTQKEKVILHLINLTNQNTGKQPLDQLISTCALHIKIKKKQALKGHIQLLVSSQKIIAKVSEDYVSFEIPSLLDHEVVI